MEFYTIGVYNTAEEDFFNKLIENRIDTFCDIRQRRGVRGAKYAFVNSKRLQKYLNGIKINYVHAPALAPTSGIRDLQKEADAQNRELKTQRQQLGDVFVIEYKHKILNKFCFESFIEKLDQAGAKRVVLFCVEEHPQACHRSIVANRLKEQYNFKILHL